MLVLTRQRGEKIRLALSDGRFVDLVVRKISEDRVVLALDAPDSVRIDCAENLTLYPPTVSSSLYIPL